MLVVHLSAIPSPDSVEYATSWVAWLNQATTTTFALYDDNPIDDEKLCTVHKDGELWHIRYQGRKKIYTQLIGPSEAVTSDNLWQAMVELWEKVRTAEGATRRQ